MTQAAVRSRGREPAPQAIPISAAGNRRGIAAMLLATLLFACSDALVKVAAADLPTGQVMAVRGALAMLFVVALIGWRREHPYFRHLRDARVLLRSGIEATISFLFVLSIAHLALANITAILLATPIIAVAAAAALGIERIGWRRWAAVLVGFAGVLLIVRPSPEGFNLYAVLTLLTAILVVGRDFVTRGVAAHIPTTIVTLSTNLVTSALGFAVALGEGWAPMGRAEWGLLAGAALFVSLGNLAVVQAFRVGEIAVVSPFRYFAIPSALALGLAVFGEWPDTLSGLGIALIVASGLYAIHRERSRARAA